MPSNRKNGRPQLMTREQGDRLIILLERLNVGIEKLNHETAETYTGIENCLHQLKLSNRKLEELI